MRITQPLSVGYSGKLTVELNTVGLMPGDTLSGLIRIVYNGGERELPYHFTIGMVQGGEADLSFMTLQDFVAFANENYEEAARIFFWKEFTKMPFMHDLHLMGLYHTFYSTTRQDAGLSAFLSACGYTVDFGNRAEKPAKPQVLRTMNDSAKGQELKRTYTEFALFMELERTLKAGNAAFDERFQELVEAYPDDMIAHLLYCYEEIQNGTLIRETPAAKSYCGSCGAALEPNARFCSSCGAPQTAGVSEN